MASTKRRWREQDETHKCAETLGDSETQRTHVQFKHKTDICCSFDQTHTTAQTPHSHALTRRCLAAAILVNEVRVPCRPMASKKEGASIEKTCAMCQQFSSVFEPSVSWNTQERTGGDKQRTRRRKPSTQKNGGDPPELVCEKTAKAKRNTHTKNNDVMGASSQTRTQPQTPSNNTMRPNFEVKKLAPATAILHSGLLVEKQN